MNTVKLNDYWLRLRSKSKEKIKPMGPPLASFVAWSWSAIKFVGRVVARLGPWSWSAAKFVGRALRRLRPVVPGAIVTVLIAATVFAVAWLHSAARTSPDAWPTSVAAGTSAALALVTVWYAYLTHRLLEAQRLSARTAGWETALRDLSLYLNRERAVIWGASEFFPLDRPGADPPDLMALANSKVEFVRVRDHLLEILGLLPRSFVVRALPLTMSLVNAESEINALFHAIFDAMETGRAAGNTTWTWDDARQAHEASDDPERSEAWADIARGRYFYAAEQSWDDLSSAVDNHLVG